MVKHHNASMMLGSSELKLEFSKYAPKATVSVLGQMGDTVILTTIVSGNESSQGWFPLSVEYAEKLYASGIIKGSRWVKREGKPTEEAILKARLIDRSIRPLFPKEYKREVQIVCTLLSLDDEHAADILAAITVSAGLHVSNIPWSGPIGTTRVGYVPAQSGSERSIVVNPTDDILDTSSLDLVVSSTPEKVLMIETGAHEIKEDVLQEGIKLAHETNNKITTFIEDIRSEIGLEKDIFEPNENIATVKSILKRDYMNQVRVLLEKQAQSDSDRNTAAIDFANEIAEKNTELASLDKKVITEAIENKMYELIKEDILKDGKRPDGRKIDEIRHLSAANSVLPRTHGSAVFQRGLTQVLTITTLGSTSLEQLIESVEGEESKRYIHHYFSPPYSYGEAGRMGWPGRREIGHGALAEKAIEPVLPSKEEFPYTIRVVSEVMSSNGSTSMASTCGSSLSLMDAGVPLKAAVAGISIGLVWESDDNYVLLTDIAGIEDFAGHMDFKVAGTTDGVTAIQLDVKNNGLTLKMIEEIFDRAKSARMKVLDVMNAAINKPRPEISKYAPKVVMLTPPADKIGEIIGPGGKNIKRIIAETGADIDIDDEGKVSISGIDVSKVQDAVEQVKAVYRQIDVGEVFDGTVKKLLPIGAMVEFMPGRSGLVHVSKLAKGFVKDPKDVVSEGQSIKVRVFQIDSQGRYNLERIEG